MPEEYIDVEKEIVFDPYKENQTIVSFDPTQIETRVETINLGYVINLIENGEIELDTDYQRSANPWSQKQKSRLIESILLGFPLPAFYFSEDVHTEKLIIIDGLRRLQTISEFVLEKNDDKKLKLQELQFLTELEGCTFEELKRPQVRRFLGVNITMNLLTRYTSQKVKYIIFQRLNSSENFYTNQEIRHALNPGQAVSFVKRLAKSEAFLQATANSVNSQQMLDCEFVTRFLAFYIKPVRYQGDLVDFLNETMELLNRFSIEKLDVLADAFEVSMYTCHNIFGTDAFRRRYNKTDSENPISEALFDTLSVNVALLSATQKNLLINRKEIFIEKWIALFNDEDSNFDRCTRVGTGEIVAVNTRFEKVAHIINETLEL